MAVLISAIQVGVDAIQQLTHRPTAMVAGDVVVEIFPGPLDAIVIRAVRLQKVQPNAFAGRPGPAHPSRPLKYSQFPRG